MIEAAQWGLKEAMAEYEEARIVGKINDEGGVMVAATTGKAKVSGILVEKNISPMGPLEAAATSALVAMLQECERRITAKPVDTIEHRRSDAT